MISLSVTVPPEGGGKGAVCSVDWSVCVVDWDDCEGTVAGVYFVELCDVDSFEDVCSGGSVALTGGVVELELW